MENHCRAGLIRCPHEQTKEISRRSVDNDGRSHRARCPVSDVRGNCWDHPNQWISKSRFWDWANLEQNAPNANSTSAWMTVLPGREIEGSLQIRVKAVEATGVHDAIVDRDGGHEFGAPMIGQPDVQCTASELTCRDVRYWQGAEQ